MRRTVIILAAALGGILFASPSQAQSRGSHQRPGAQTDESIAPEGEQIDPVINHVRPGEVGSPQSYTGAQGSHVQAGGSPGSYHVRPGGSTSPGYHVRPGEVSPVGHRPSRYTFRHYGGPRPHAWRLNPSHHTVVVNRGGPVVTAQPVPSRPERAVDHTGDLSVGILGGSYMGGYDGGTSYGDFGLGLVGRFRAADSLGFEASLAQYRGGEGERISTPVSLSIEAFAFPFSKVDPYFLTGVTWVGRNYDDIYCDGFEYLTYQAQSNLFGPHAGLGLEFAVGRNAAIDLEARVTGAMNVAPDDPAVPINVQTNLGLQFYF